MTITIPRKTLINGRLYSREVAEMIQETRIAQAMRRRPELSSNEQYYANAVLEILDDMGHPLRHNQRFITAFARRLARITKTENA